jgi:hypothetical protein
VSNRIIDAPSAEKLSTLIGIAKDNTLAVSIDYLGGSKNDLWIIQIFDMQERLVVSANGKTMIEAVRRIHENWFNKTAPKT